MTIEELQIHLREVIESGKNKKTDKVVFRNEHPAGTLSEVDYLLTAAVSESLVLCWDDGSY